LVLTVVYKWAIVVALFSKMNRVTYISLIFYLSLSLISCTSSLDPAGLEFERKMVLHCLFEPNQPWKAVLATNRNLLIPDDSTTFVSDASLVLYDGSGRKIGDFETLGNGEYSLSDNFPVPGGDYRIEVTHPALPPLSAESSLPQAFSLEVLERDRIEVGEQDKQLFSCRIESPGLSMGRLVVQNRLERLYVNTAGDSILVEDWDLLEHTDHSDHSDPFLPAGAVDEILCFSGINDYLEFGFYGYNGFRKSDETSLVKGTAELQVSLASEEYYRYIRTLEAYRKSGTKLVSSFLPPVELYSNITGGLGIFAGRNRVGSFYAF
jgi:hypothetical protein